MKYTLTILIFFVMALMSSFTTLETPIRDQYVYRDLGVYENRFPDGSVIKIKAYILKESNYSNQNSQYRNMFTLIGVSQSVHKNTITETWLYNTRVMFNGQELTANQYPNGFTFYVKTTPVVVYNWYTNDNDIGTFFFNWSSSAYEPRL